MFRYAGDNVFPSIHCNCAIVLDGLILGFVFQERIADPSIAFFSTRLCFKTTLRGIRGPTAPTGGLARVGFGGGHSPRFNLGIFPGCSRMPLPLRAYPAQTFHYCCRISFACHPDLVTHIHAQADPPPRGNGTGLAHNASLWSTSPGPGPTGSSPAPAPAPPMYFHSPSRRQPPAPQTSAPPVCPEARTIPRHSLVRCPTSPSAEGMPPTTPSLRKGWVRVGGLGARLNTSAGRCMDGGGGSTPTPPPPPPTPWPAQSVSWVPSPSWYSQISGFQSVSQNGSQDSTGSLFRWLKGRPEL